MDINVSVIIVNWNGIKWLNRCLDSLTIQTYKSFETILVDNASADDSVEYVSCNYPQVRIVRSTVNRGFAGGNNLGIEHARGSLILLLNNDTWVEKDFLEKMVQGYAASSCDVVGPKEVSYDSNDVSRPIGYGLDRLGHCVILKDDREGYFYLSGVCLMFKKSLYEETGGLDDGFFMYFEEIDWFWRLHLLDKKTCGLSGITVHHAGSGSTGGGLRYLSFLWRNQNSLQMLLKNYSWWNLLWVLPSYLAVNLVEIAFFLIIGKPMIAWSYIEGWIFNFRRIGATLHKRKWVQENRKMSDGVIMRRMHSGFGKWVHLIKYFTGRIKSRAPREV